MASRATTFSQQWQLHKKLRRRLLSCLPPHPEILPLPLKRQAVRPRHYIGGIIYFALCVVMISAAIAISPLALVSPVYLAALAVHWAIPELPAVIAFWALYFCRFFQMMKQLNGRGGFWNGVAQVALREEQKCRLGAENWSTGERAKSCVTFGLVHLWNLFYPLALLVPVAGSGAFFMWMYLRKYRKTHSRREALTEAALYHYAFNRIAMFGFTVIVVSFTSVQLLPQ